MLLAGIAFLFGVVSLRFLPELPPIYFSFLMLFVVPLAFKFPRWRSIAVFVCGFCWALWMAHLAMDELLPRSLENHELRVYGTVVSIPAKRARSIRFEFVIDELPEIDSGETKLPMKVRLDWYGKTPPVSAGQRWQFLLRLKAPHGFMNPGGFDYEGWLFQEGLRATGYVRNSEQNILLKAETLTYPITQIRQRIFDKLVAVPATGSSDALANKGILAALTLADEQFISAFQWDLFRKTGTSHLVAISGLNIGLIAGMTYWLAMRLLSLILRFTHRTPRWPAQQLAALAAMVAATVYSALADFTIPTTRALIMLAVIFSGLLLRRELQPAQGIALALLLVLILDPLAVNNAGFWLSFIAVAAILIMLYGRKPPDSKLLHGSILQLRLALVLLPVTLIWFQQAALSSTAANLLAIPLVGMLIVPLALLGTALLFIWESVGQLLLNLADMLVNVLWLLLEWVSKWPFGQWQQQSPPFWTWLPAMFGAYLLLMPRGLPARWLGIVFMLPIFLVLPKRAEQGAVWFTVLDVGQGLSAIVETQNHTLVYDTGAQFTEDFDAGKAVLVPFLQNRNVRRIDKIVASHADDDHVGGLHSVIAEIPVDEIISGVPEDLLKKYAISSLPCQRGQAWIWDEVKFTVLHPAIDNDFSGNNASCVIKVETSHGRILLTGDIEKKAERYLLEAYRNDINGENLQADIVTVPHHGSRTSSTKDLIDSVKPRYAVFSVGHLNRFGFPKADIVQRYQDRKAVILNSSESGAITFVLNKDSIAYSEFRQEQKRYWHWQK